MIARTALLCALLWLPGVARAASTPEQVASDYMQSLSQSGMSETGRFFDVAALEGMKELLLPVLQFETQQGQSQLRTAMFGATSLEEVEALPPVDFFNGFMRFLESRMAQFQVRISGSKLLGTIHEGPDLSHVVARFQTGVGETTTSTVNVVSMRRVGDEWKIVLRADVRNMASALRQQLLRQSP